MHTANGRRLRPPVGPICRDGHDSVSSEQSENLPFESVIHEARPLGSKSTTGRDSTGWHRGRFDVNQPMSAPSVAPHTSEQVYSSFQSPGNGLPPQCPSVILTGSSNRARSR